MLNKQKILLILVFGFALLNIWLLLQAKKFRKVIELENEYFNETVILKERIFSYLITNRFIDSVCNFEKSPIYENILGREMIALVISEEDCSSCILNEVYNLEKVYNIYEDVLFLCDFSSLEKAYSFFHSFGYDSLNCQLISRAEYSPISKFEKLPYSLLSEDGCPTMVFHPDKTINFLTLEYLHYLNKRFLNNSY